MSIRKHNQALLTGTIGNTNVLLSRYGCLICSICSLHSRFWPKNPMYPQEAAKTWRFTSRGLLKWGSQFEGMTFVDRVGGPPSKEDCLYWIRSKNKGMVLELNDGAHWVFAYYYPFNIGAKGIVTIDSNGGKINRLFKSPYRVTGYATFRKSVA